MYLASKKCDLYSEISKRGFLEEPTLMKTTLQQMRKDNLKYRHLCLHDTMSTKINMFDERLVLLKRKRIDVMLQIIFLDLFALTLEEELLIFNDYDLLEDDCEYNLFLRTGIQNEKAKQVNMNIRTSIRIITNNTIFLCSDFLDTVDSGRYKILSNYYRREKKIDHGPPERF